MAEILDKAIVCFYVGDSLPCLAVRWDTRRAGQAFRDVPAHCAIILSTEEGPLLYEFISTGWQRRLATSQDVVWTVTVPLPNPDAARQAAEGCAGSRYSWAEIALIALYRLLPDRWLSRIHVRQAHICSVFVRDVLWAGGWTAPGWLARQFCPPSPNDLLRALKPLKEVTHAGS